MGGIIAGEGVVVTGPGPIGLMGVGVAKALGAQPVILTGTRQRRLEMGRRLGADEVVNVTSEDPVEAVQRITQGKGVQYVLECSGAPNALNEAARMVNRGGRICLAAFPADPVVVDLAYLVRNGHSRGSPPSSPALGYYAKGLPAAVVLLRRNRTDRPLQ